MITAKCPVFIDNNGKPHACIGYAIDLRINWEWYAFEDMGNGIYFGYVMGFENEWGDFSVQELAENNINFTTDPEILNDLMPPIGWKKEQEVK